MQRRELDLIRVTDKKNDVKNPFDELLSEYDDCHSKEIISDKHEALRLLFETILPDVELIDKELLYAEEFISMLIEDVKKNYSYFCTLIRIERIDGTPDILLLREVHYAAIRDNGMNVDCIPEQLFEDLDLCR